MNKDKEIKKPDRELLVKMYRNIRTIRLFEETGMELYRNGYIRGYFHLYIGEEGIASGACGAIRPDDYIVSTHRGHGHYIAKGAELNKIMAELFGKKAGYAHGRSGSMHIADMSTGIVGGNGIVGGGIPLAVGVGMGIRQEQSDRVVLCFFGDGAANCGTFAESLNLAAIYRLPVIFILENNFYAATTHVTETSLCEKLSDRGTGYGVESKTVFGNDPLEVYHVVSEAVEKSRRGHGPTFIEAMTYRFYGHHVNDPGTYMPGDVTKEWKSRDPLDIMIQHLRDNGIDDSVIAHIDNEIQKAIDAAVAFAKQSPEPCVDEFKKEISYYDI
ncbi:thiamine pyrophosphate-dependent dehydrogenase E1 component subunit alpha [Candidatus Latescibacterota bacterium]